MRKKIGKIKSFWQNETGRWDETKGGFIDRKWSDVFEKELTIEYAPTTDVLYFVGGPTGFESYMLESLKEGFERVPGPKNDQDNFCICGGTINRWSACWVKTEDVRKLIQKVIENGTV